MIWHDRVSSVWRISCYIKLVAFEFLVTALTREAKSNMSLQALMRVFEVLYGRIPTLAGQLVCRRDTDKEYPLNHSFIFRVGGGDY